VSGKIITDLGGLKMTEKNDEKNGEKKDEKRDKKGQFKKGHSGGPGRGKKKPLKPVTFEEIEGWLQDDLKNRDPKIRHSATKLLMTLRDKIEKQSQGNVSAIPPEVMQFMDRKADDVTEDPDIITVNPKPKPSNDKGLQGDGD
jgi:hypothetical protein